MLHLFGKVFLFAVVVNFPWEMAQAYLYAPMGDWLTATTRCVGAAIVDAAIVVGVVIAGRAVFRRWDWIRRLTAERILFTIAAGASVAVLIERLALRSGRWDYAPLMPIIPGLGVGLVPVMQMIVLPLLVFRVVGRSEIR